MRPPPSQQRSGRSTDAVAGPRWSRRLRPVRPLGACSHGPVRSGRSTTPVPQLRDSGCVIGSIGAHWGHGRADRRTSAVPHRRAPRHRVLKHPGPGARRTGPERVPAPCRPERRRGAPRRSGDLRVARWRTRRVDLTSSRRAVRSARARDATAITRGRVPSAGSCEHRGSHRPRLRRRQREFMAERTAPAAALRGRGRLASALGVPYCSWERFCAAVLPSGRRRPGSRRSSAWRVSCTPTGTAHRSPSGASR
jgi:hypothetical protein